MDIYNKMKMRLNRKRKLFIALLVSLVIAAGAYFLYPLHRPRYPNILLITIDALRPDHLSCHGYKRNTSPNIDKLARKGVLFTQAISQASWTCPSIHSLITSTYPSTHGGYFWDQVFPDSIPILPQILKEKGYYTGFISGHGGLSKIGGFSQQVFDTFEDIFSAKSDEITQKAMLWLQKNRNTRFFLWIHYMDTHDGSIGVPEEKHFIKNITSEEINTYTLRYDKAISYVDSQISGLLRELKEIGLYKNTLIIITADHGEEMGEHNLCFTHGGFLWDSVIKVPLIIFYQSLFPKDKIITQQVQLIDIAPTICDILKVKKPKSFEGRSLLPLIKGENIYSTYAFSEHKENKGDLSAGDWIYTKLSIRTLEWKLFYTYTLQSKEYELYNLKADPQELHNLVEIEKKQFKFLKVKLEEWMSRPKPNITSLTISLDDDTKERLRGLGYLQ